LLTTAIPSIATFDGAGISLLVPYRGDKAERTRNWSWLRSYWQTYLPKAEIIEHDAGGRLFWKTKTLNECFAKSTGDVVVTMDADFWLPAHEIQLAAEMIRHGTKWIAPYVYYYRLTKLFSQYILSHDPAVPPAVELPPKAPHECCGWWDGACGISVTPRAAWEAVGYQEERYRGWSAEDYAWWYKLDTLWGEHVKVATTAALHLWHPTREDKRFARGLDVFENRWRYQSFRQSRKMKQLARRYEEANGNPDKMRELINEHG
jgi:glycosyltransferase involved in cell wall biosynthesis